MGSDLFALSALARELNDNLQGARIDKIQQPESDELRFFVRSKGKISALWCLATQARRESTSRRAKKSVRKSRRIFVCFFANTYCRQP